MVPEKSEAIANVEESAIEEEFAEEDESAVLEEIVEVEATPTAGVSLHVFFPHVPAQ